MAFKMNRWSAFTKEIDPVTGKERKGGKKYRLHKESAKVEKTKEKVKVRREGADSEEDDIKPKPTMPYNLNNNVKNTIDSLIMEGGYEHTMLKQIIENNKGAKQYISDFHFYNYE